LQAVKRAHILVELLLHFWLLWVGIMSALIMLNLQHGVDKEDALFSKLITVFHNNFVVVQIFHVIGMLLQLADVMLIILRVHANSQTILLIQYVLMRIIN
jgi:hypothetical protein